MDKVKAPIYNIFVESRDQNARNEKIDAEIKKHFIGSRVCIRVLGSSVHKEKTIEELVGIIRDIGTDRYDPTIKSDRYYNKEGRNIDFFALDFVVGFQTKILDEFTWRKKLRPPLLIDVIIVYDADHVEMVVYTPIGREKKKFDGFVFKNIPSKPKAIKAIFRVMDQQDEK